MTTKDDKHRAEVHRQKARNHLIAAAQLLGEEPEEVPVVDVPVVQTTTRETYPPKPAQSREEIDAFVAACARRNSRL